MKRDRTHDYIRGNTTAAAIVLSVNPQTFGAGLVEWTRPPYLSRHGAGPQRAQDGQQQAHDEPAPRHAAPFGGVAQSGAAAVSQ